MGARRARYLVFFQYLGTDFRGVMAIKPPQAGSGVQNHLERAAERLGSEEPVGFTISSRTDSGAHALCNSAHIDVCRPEGREPHAPDLLTRLLNHHLEHPAIRVLRTVRVADDFHARFSATSRRYVYRLVSGCSHPRQLPVWERKLCWVTRATQLDVAAMREAAGHLVGTHDFSAFRSTSGCDAWRNPVKTLVRATVAPGPPGPLARHSDCRLQFWELEFESRSFLYKQVRRMTGALVSVGQGLLHPQQVQEMLASGAPPSQPYIRIVPAWGLFLKSVGYQGLGEAPPLPDPVLDIQPSMDGESDAGPAPS
ncbi:tRNA pseudouridine synthase-like 1 isoform X2 [Tachyglossus aculeatus]|uniref:tRNA pseudouridine synthase-like 1 isoform X2 n=1 Tax=Tachyglossus aculeatus TaxID=9261 RepID=UPI0018F616E5|nr:tRNA pseudouridine synthase-like 1 isoform X2 [Tachyglossus aculeatus]